MKATKEHVSISSEPRSSFLPSLLPSALVIAMLSTLLILGAILPLYGLWFQSSLQDTYAPWVLLPARVLFPTAQLTPLVPNMNTLKPSLADGWAAMGLLFTGFLLLFAVYTLALRVLPTRVTRRFILLSTLLFGLVAILMPVVTSPDVYSYIIYARMGAIYHLNPLTTLPRSLPTDPALPYIYWNDQASAYGPTWILLSCGLQWLLALPGITQLAPMLLSLRVLGLLAHLGSCLLLCSISDTLFPTDSPALQLKRMGAFLAFAWNPLLLLEACVNAHNDTIVLFLVLLMLRVLIMPGAQNLQVICMALLLAMITCLKLNVGLFLPALLLFYWTQPRRVYTLPLLLLVYLATIIALYAPFWDHGALLNLLRTNPGTSRNINTLAEFLTELLHSIFSLFLVTDQRPLLQNLFHTLSLGLFVCSLGVLAVRALLPRNSLPTPLALFHWMAWAWFLYCVLGSPWFWQWYTCVFFGLFALLYMSKPTTNWHDLLLCLLMFSFTLLSSYCFYTPSPYDTTVPGLAGFRWAFLRGLWIWCPFLLLIPRARYYPVLWTGLTGYLAHLKTAYDTNKANSMKVRIRR